MNSWSQTRCISTRRVAIAIGAALLADIVQVPATLAVLSGVFSVEAVALDLVIDFGMAVFSIALLGFHIMLLPTALAESIPGVNLAPTWTACVSYVVWSRRSLLITGKKQERT